MGLARLGWREYVDEFGLRHLETDDAFDAGCAVDVLAGCPCSSSAVDRAVLSERSESK